MKSSMKTTSSSSRTQKLSKLPTIQEIENMANQSMEARRKKLQHFTIGEKLEEARQFKVLSSHEHKMQEWENLRKLAAKKSGRTVGETVLACAEEYREKLEVMDLLEKSVPEDVKSSGLSWYQSLRGAGTSYIQVGNMFSGLYVPLHTKYENIEPEIIRNPWMNEVVKARGGNHSGPHRRHWRTMEYLVERE